MFAIDCSSVLRRNGKRKGKELNLNVLIAGVFLITTIVLNMNVNDMAENELELKTLWSTEKSIRNFEIVT